MLSTELTFLRDTYSSGTSEIITINLEVLTYFTITRRQYDDKTIRSLLLNHTISAELIQLMSLSPISKNFNLSLKNTRITIFNQFHLN